MYRYLCLIIQIYYDVYCIVQSTFIRQSQSVIVLSRFLDDSDDRGPTLRCKLLICNQYNYECHLPSGYVHHVDLHINFLVKYNNYATTL